MPEYTPILDGARAAALIVALAVDFAIGWIPAVARLFAAPSLALAACFSWIGSKLDRAHRSAAALRMRGAVVISFVAAIAAGVGLALAGYVEGRADRSVLEGVFVLLLLRGRQIFLDIAPVARALRNHGADAARTALARAVPRDTRELDEHAVARRAIELAAHRFGNGLVAPGLWYLVAGLPGFLVYCGVSLCAERAAPFDAPSQPFGAAPRILQFILDIVPAPVAGLLLSAAAIFVPAASAPRAIRTMLADSRFYGAHGAGWMVAATAGALGLALGGPRRGGGAADSTRWIGQGRARAHASDVQRTVYLVAVGCLLFAAALGIVALAAVGV